MSTRPRLNDQRIAEALNLLKHSDSVEFKLTVPDTDQHSAVTALDLDPLEAELRQVVFFDTPDLKLSRGGLVVAGQAHPTMR